MTQPKSVTLYCREGSADKEYQLHLQESPAGGFLVNFAFGRRGSALKQGTKTQAPVDADTAEKIYAKLLKEKTGKGYTEAESGMRYVGTDLESRDSGLTPQLPTAIRQSDVMSYEMDDDWVAQEKFDGENRIVTITANEIGGVNRRGLTCPVPAIWNPANVESTSGRTVICGEDMGDHLAAFDLIEHNGRDLRHLTYLERHRELGRAAQTAPWIKVAPIASGTFAKRELLKKIEADGGEGLVYKKAHATFDGGRSLNAMKHKFQESSTFVVSKVNDQRSVAIALHDENDQLVPMGNVTVPANYPVPSVGSLVEVEYMYRYEGGALMQPKYKGERTDLTGPVRIDQIQRIKAKAA